MKIYDGCKSQFWWQTYKMWKSISLKIGEIWGWGGGMSIALQNDGLLFERGAFQVYQQQSGDFTVLKSAGNNFTTFFQKLNAYFNTTFGVRSIGPSSFGCTDSTVKIFKTVKSPPCLLNIHFSLWNIFMQYTVKAE